MPLNSGIDGPDTSKREVHGVRTYTKGRAYPPTRPFHHSLCRTAAWSTWQAQLEWSKERL